MSGTVLGASDSTEAVRHSSSTQQALRLLLRWVRECTLGKMQESRAEGDGPTRGAAAMPQGGRCSHGVGGHVTTPTQFLEGKKGFPKTVGFKLRGISQTL